MIFIFERIFIAIFTAAPTPPFLFLKIFIIFLEFDLIHFTEFSGHLSSTTYTLSTKLGISFITLFINLETL